MVCIWGSGSAWRTGRREKITSNEDAVVDRQIGIAEHSTRFFLGVVFPESSGDEAVQDDLQITIVLSSDLSSDQRQAVIFKIVGKLATQYRVAEGINLG